MIQPIIKTNIIEVDQEVREITAVITMISIIIIAQTTIHHQLNLNIIKVNLSFHKYINTKIMN